MVNESRLFDDANSLFIQRRFDEALFLYSLLTSHFPENKEYKLYPIFCDIALEDENKAIALFDYFSIMKVNNLDEAIKYVEDMINAYDGDIEKMMNLLKDFNNSAVDSLEAIKYEDFKNLVEERGSFKIAFEDIMFSTKVAIETKEDFYDFITKLIDNGFSSTAYNYLEGFNEYFTYDKEILKLYEKLEEKKNETNHKR